jgi:periplasmic protein TonB
MLSRRTVVQKDEKYESWTRKDPTPQATSPRILRPVSASIARHRVFAEALLENVKIPRPRRAAEVAGAFVIQGLILAALVLIPLLHTQAIDVGRLNSTYLVAPAPPAPPPPPPPAASAAPQPAPVKKQVFDAKKLTVPTMIPKQVAIVKDQAPGAPTIDTMTGVSGGVAGGVPGGQVGGVLGGVLGGVIGGVPQVAPPQVVAPPAEPSAPIRVGGNIRQPRLITKVDPIYPPLARQSRIQGEVVIDAIIDPQGNVSQAKIISGHPMLIQAALDAIRKWKYEPTLLNGQPVAVELQAHVQFHFE